VRLAIIGCGNMGSAVVRGLLDAGWTTRGEIIATHPDPDRANEISQRLGIEATTNNAKAAKGAEIILLGIKPQLIKRALQDLRGQLKPNQLVISIAAGISTRFIETYLPDSPIVRSMPNLPVTIAAGATAISAGSNASANHLASAEEIFRAVGIVEVIPEYLMDAVTGLSGTGPMYVFHFLEAMADAGVRMGLPRDVATRLSTQTIRGAAKLAELSELHPAALKDQVTSPGGTAIAALHVLRREAFSAIVMDAVAEATKRSAELGD